MNWEGEAKAAENCLVLSGTLLYYSSMANIFLGLFLLKGIFLTTSHFNGFAETNYL